MACNTKPGPAAAIKVYEEATGIHLTQKDWHLIREEARLNSGGKLSREVISDEDARTVAADFYDAAYAGREIDPAAREQFITEFAAMKNTAGTLHTIDEITQNGLPKAVLERPRKGTVATPPAPAQPAGSMALVTSESMSANGVLTYSSASVLGPVGASSDDRIKADSALLADIMAGKFPDRDFTPEEGVKASLEVRAAADAMREQADLIGADLAERLHDNGIKSIHDGVTGTTLSPHSGYRYRGWDHEGIQSEVENGIAVNRDLDRGQVKAVVDAYTEYAAVDGYRTPALREYGLRAKDYAEGVPGQRSVAVSFPDRDDFVPTSAVGAVLDSSKSIAMMPADAAAARERIASLPLEDAVREYVAVRHTERRLTRIAAGVESDAATKIMNEGLDTVAGYRARTTAGGERWDAEALERRLVPRIAEKAGVEPRVAQEVIADFKEVARVGRYKVRGLKAADLDADEYRSKTPGTRKLERVDEAAAA